MAHRSRPGVFVIDCQTDDLSEAAAFWSAALGEQVIVDDDGKYARVGDYDRSPRLLLQAVDHAPRIHMDIETDDREAEAARLEAAGARRIETRERWIIMQAPSGHRFCLVGPQGEDFAEGAKIWGDA
jgi:catechol 2,3-dioxygenase-like lactoylglutathione lyase family enzyme